MKIAMIGTTLFRQGSEYVLAALARGLSKRGHDVTVILLKYYDDLRKAHPDWKPFNLGANVRLIVLPSHRIRESVLPLYKVLVANNFDIVLDHTGFLTFPMVVSGIFMIRRPAFIHVEHLWVGVNEHGLPIKPHKTFAKRLYQLFTRCLDAQFTVSEGTSDAIARMTGFPRSRIYTVFNPVLDDIFYEKLQSNPRHPWLNEPDVPVVVAAGVYTPVKNHALLLRAWAEVVKEQKARLVIFGEGGLRNEYERLIGELNIEESVSLPGFTDNLPAELKNAACFVVSSYVESFSVVLVEALASGVPVVATDCPYGPGEILQRGRYGLLVKNNDETALANGILQVLRGRCEKPPPESYLPFTIDAVIDRYENAMQDVLHKRGAK